MRQAGRSNGVVWAKTASVRVEENYQWKTIRLGYQIYLRSRSEARSTHPKGETVGVTTNEHCSVSITKSWAQSAHRVIRTMI